MAVPTTLLRSQAGFGSKPMRASADATATDSRDQPIASEDHAHASPVSPQRVLYVVSQFPSLSETFIVREITALIDRGVDIRILSLKTSREPLVQPQAAALLDRVLHPAGRWRTFASVCAVLCRQPQVSLGFFATMLRELWRRPATFAKSMVAIFRMLGRFDEIRSFAPELVHAPWATYPATVAWYLSRLLDRPFSFTSRAHDIFIEDHMMARKLRSASLAVAITQYNVSFMSRWMPAPGAIPVHVIHSSLDLSELSFERDGRIPGKLLSVGRLVPMKGFDILLRALVELRTRGIEFHCTVIGEGEERARLESLRAKLGLDGVVEFPGAMSQCEVVRHMTESTLMVLPCVVAPNGQSDGIPNVLMESMATGLPVVSTRISGIPELVEDGVTGRLVPAGNALALADAVQALLRDPRQRDSLAAAGRRKVESDFDVRIEAGRLLEHFRTACHG